MDLIHALNRGVEKRTIFTDNRDRARFVHDLFEFNDKRPADNDRRHATMIEIRSQSFKKRVPIVDIHGWCLMGNHYHLLLSERVDGGISQFLRKLNVGYAMYFNERHRREGTLFQGRTKKIRITTNAHFLHILHYIHLNPLDFLDGSQEWRSGVVKNAAKALQYLGSYRWSSYPDYCNEKNFPSIVEKNYFASFFKDYKKVLSNYLREIELEPIEPFLLE